MMKVRGNCWVEHQNRRIGGLNQGSRFLESSRVLPRDAELRTKR